MTATSPPPPPQTLSLSLTHTHTHTETHTHTHTHTHTMSRGRGGGGGGEWKASVEDGCMPCQWLNKRTTLLWGGKAEEHVAGGKKRRKKEKEKKKTKRKRWGHAGYSASGILCPVPDTYYPGSRQTAQQWSNIPVGHHSDTHPAQTVISQPRPKLTCWRLVCNTDP